MVVLTSPASIWINAEKTRSKKFFRILILQIAHLVPAFPMASVEPSRGVHSSNSDPPSLAGAMGTLERPTSVPFPPVWSPTKGGCLLVDGGGEGR